MIFFDTETVGLTGPIALLQYAIDDGPVELFAPWNNTVRDSLELIEFVSLHEGGICGFNLTFDYFHLYQMWTTLRMMQEAGMGDEILIDKVDEYAEFEERARDYPLVLKPYTACDILLVARKGPYQSTMDRKDIRIRKVPTNLAWQLAEELEQRIKLNKIYFARRKDKSAPQWNVYDRETEDGDPDPHFKDVVLKFAASAALKALAVDALGKQQEQVLLFSDIDLEDYQYPTELGYAPFAKAIGDRHNWRNAWPDKVRAHNAHWSYYERAREYAKNDVLYTRELYHFFEEPEPGDDDSILATMVGISRWRGWKVNIDGIKKLREEALSRDYKYVDESFNGVMKKVKFYIPTAPEKSRIYITEMMNDDEKLILEGSTKKILLQEIAGWKDHPAAARATEVLDARLSGYEVDFYDKLILAQRLHASFSIIGTLSSRMSGTDGLNAHGIKKTTHVRSQFPLFFDPMILCGGDFSGFEVTLADACYNDPGLRKDLLSGKKIHALFGQYVFPGMSYEEILATDGTSDDKYNKCKQAVFAMFYGGEGYTLKDRLGVDLEIADKAYALFCQKYPQVGIARQKVFNMFCSMRQPGGIGSKVEWHEPAQFIESMFGFRRYFTLENRICQALFGLANNPPKPWHKIKLRVVRRDRMQTASGAVQSALYAGAFALQASNMRAAANHVIQSSGAQITKAVQRRIWDLQPIGIHKWIVQPMNIHDEILCPVAPGYVDTVQGVVKDSVESFRPKVPLIAMGWKTHAIHWSDVKKG